MRRINNIIGIVLVILGSLFSLTPAPTYAQTTSPTWQDLPQDAFKSFACFDGANSHIIWKKEGNAYDYRTNTKRTNGFTDAYSMVYCHASGWVYLVHNGFLYRQRVDSAPVAVYPVQSIYNLTTTTDNTLVLTVNNPAPNTQAHHALTTAISTDFGATWTSQQHPFDDQIIATYTPLNNAQRVYVLTLPKYTFQSNDEVPRNYPRTIKAVTLWKSDNAGRTWRTQSTITLPQPCRIDISEPNMGYVYSADSCYYKNYTIEFVDMPTRYTAPNTVAVAIRYANHALPHTQIFFSANSGLQWQKIRDVTGSERTVSDIRFFNNTPNPAIIYTATNALFESYSQSHHMTRHALDYYIDNIAQAPALTSTNNRTWRTITPTSDTCTSTNPTGITVVTMASTPTVQVCKNNAGIFVTTDGGTTWHAISDDFPYAELIAISNTAPLTIIRQRCTPPNWDNRGTSPSKTCTTYQYAQIPTLAAALTSVTSTIPHGLPYEPATQHTIDPRFLAYWQHNGGLAQFGYPKTEPFYEVDEAGNILLVQYFERNRFEYHPENAGTPYTVQLGLIGNYFGAKAQQAQPGPFARQNGDTEPGQLYFAETGHTLRNAFKRHWLGTGGLAQYGYPISEEFYEVNPVDGQMYVVQYFERARFEWHPEHIGTPYEVLLGLLGSQLLSEKISE